MKYFVRRFFICLLIFLPQGTFSPAFAGKLSDFEADIKSEKKSNIATETRPVVKDHVNKHHGSGKGANCRHSQRQSSFFDYLSDELVIEAAGELGKAIGAVLVIGGQNSQERIDEKGESGSSRARKPGELLLPFFKLNVNTQHVSESIDGLDVKLEVGRGLLAAEVRATRYQEKAVNEKLDYQQLQAFYRMLFGNTLGVNIGIGWGRLRGDDTYSGWLFTLPIIWHDRKHWAIELRPGWFDADGVSLTEFDGSVLYAYQRLAFRVGYRTLESPNNSIDGPYLGLDYIF